MIIRLLMTLGILIVLCGCGFGGSPLSAKYQKAVKSGKALIPEASQIEELFENTDHFISSRNRNGLHDWNTEAYFGGR